MSSKNRIRSSKRFKKNLLFFFTFVVLVAFLLLTQWDILNNHDNISEEPPLDEPTDNKKGLKWDHEKTEESVTDDETTKETYTKIRISAVGDIMVHKSQLTSAYDANTDRYDFKSVFEDVRPFIQNSDLAIANLETTLASSSVPYDGYPQFNTPDSIIDALDYAGFDTLITVNNHSLDTRAAGLKRTVQVIREKGLDSIGTYDSEPESRVLLKDVQGVKVAVLAYTEHTNGQAAQYHPEELQSMLNLMDEEQIISDIREAKNLEPDLMVAYMHWGFEYEREPNELQTRYAELMTREGVDIIFGSHPHVIQPTAFLKIDGNQSFVAYSLGNFISNQRREALGAGYESTEDGVIIHLDILKNQQTGETNIEAVEYVPTWVYRNKYEDQPQYTYRILPIEEYLEDQDFSEEIRNRMKHSYSETRSHLKISTDNEN